MIATDTPIVLAFGMNVWDEYWQTRQHVLSRLAGRGWNVGYTTPAMSIWERGGLRWRHASWLARTDCRDGVRIRYPGRLPPLLHKSAGYDDLVRARHARAFAAQIGADGARPVVAYVFHPDFLPYVEAVNPWRVVFHADDNYGAMPGVTRTTLAAQDALVRRADRIFAITDGVARALGAHATGKTLLVPNGADVDLYRGGKDCPVPPDLARIPRPTIGYAGSLNEKVDFPLIARLARARPDVHWALIGRVWDDHMLSEWSRTGLEQCRASPNVHFLGLKDHTELPAYYAHVDANAMFYRTDGEGWWHGIYPLKLHEYLATGRALLGSDTPAVRAFADVVAICRSDAEWLRAIDSAIGGGGVGTPERREAVARANSWALRVDLIDAALRDLVGRMPSVAGAAWALRPHG